MTDSADEPVLEQNAASVEDQVDGIVAQTAADLTGETPERIADVLTQRLSDAGIRVEALDLDALVARVRG